MKKVYRLRDLDCAVCAEKMERAISRLPEIQKASVSFLSQRMTLEVDDGADLEAILEQVQKAIHKVEPDCEVILK